MLVLEQEMINQYKWLVEFFSTTHRVFALVFILLGIFSAIIIPPFFGLDEAAHLHRIHQLSDGVILSEKFNSTAGGYSPRTYVEMEKLSHELRRSPKPDNKTALSDLYQVPVSEEKVIASFPGSATYSPLAYVSALPGYLISKIAGLNFGTMLIATRLTSLLFFIALVTYAVYALKEYRLKWAVVAFALMPKVVFQATVLGADSVALALAIIIFALSAKTLLERKITRSQIIILLSSMIIMPLVKFNYVFISFIPLMISVEYTGFSPKWKQRYNILRLAVALSLIAVTGVWLIVASSYGGTINQSVNPGEVSAKNQVLHLIKSPISVIRVLAETLVENGARYTSDFMYNMVGRLGYNFAPTPFIVSALSWFLLIFTFIYAKKEVIKFKAFYIKSIIISTITALGIFFVLYVTFTKVGANRVEGLQGRYFLPPVLFALPLVSFVPIAITVTKRHWPRIVLGISIANILFAYLYYLIYTYRG